MTPGARVATAIELLDLIFDGKPAEAALTGWGRRNRFAGSKDRAAIRDLVFDALRRKASSAAIGGSVSGRGLILGLLHQQGIDPAQLFTGEGYAPTKCTEHEMKTLASPAKPDEPDSLDIPGWLWADWQTSLGDKARDVAETLRSRAPIALRVNSARTDRSGAMAALNRDGIIAIAHPSPAPEFATALIVTQGARQIRNSTAFQQGLVELQDAASQAVSALVPLVPGARVLDFCAGGGGKSLALAARGANITGHDAFPERMRDLPERARRAGVRIRQADLKQLAATGPFDAVVVDVPCSGTGTWRRAPDAKWRLGPEDLDALEQVQRQIVRQAVPFLGQTGAFAYVTCSVLDRENHEMASWIGKTTGLTLAQERQFLPDAYGDGLYCAIFTRGRS